MRLSWKISRYIIQTILPYFAFAWLLLSVILFVQQASKYSDIFFNVKIPSSLVWQLSAALIPNVIAFTCPMAALVGVIIGLTKMQGDSELVAIRASGVGNFAITIPIIILGILLSLFSFFVNLRGVPFAAQVVRKVAIQSAIYKLESPIEPGVFNTEVQGYTIYVKDGDIEKGTWKKIFIYNEDKKNALVRLITSDNGRIDSSEESSELVLENALVSTLPLEGSQQKYISEHVKNLRFAIQTKRGELIERLSKTEETPEEMGLNELAAYAQTKTGKERIEANILWQRRILLSLTSLLFALLGTSLVLRFNSGRGGRGRGILLALAALVSYYLVALLGEQLARTGVISVFSAGLLPMILSCIAIAWFFYSQRLRSAGAFNFNLGRVESTPVKKELNTRKAIFSGIHTGILDFDIISNLIRYFLLTFAFLAAIYMIFTAFEMWKFAGSIDNGVNLLLRYLMYLVPFIYVQIAPSALMIATLATYVVKSRQNEIVTWTASGQSIYRLLLPCFAFMMVIGVVNWGIQEYVLPESNQKQDSLRAQIRNKGVFAQREGKNWIASDNRIYSFEFKKDGRPVGSNQMQNFSVFEFTPDYSKLVALTKADVAVWEDKKIRLIEGVKRTTWKGGIPETMPATKEESEIAEDFNPFYQIGAKPNHMNSRETKEVARNTESDDEKNALLVALEKKRSTPLLPLIITLFTAPFALTLSRKGKVMTVGYAVGIWLLFMGVTSTFDQFGNSGFLPPKIAVWGPLVLFSMLGFYLLSKIKT